MRCQEWPGRSDRGRARETTVLSLNVMDVLGATQELLTTTLGCSRTWREEPRPTIKFALLGEKKKNKNYPTGNRKLVSNFKQEGTPFL